MSTTTMTTLNFDDLVYYTVNKITTSLNKKGIEKKDFMPPRGWEKITKETMKEYVSKKHKVRCVLTGKINGITVYDFDNMETYEKVISLHPELEKCFKVKTRKGFHLYFNYHEKVPTSTDVFANYKGVDTRNDGGMVFAPPTTYNLLDKTECKYEYIGGEIMDVPAYFIDYLKINQTPPPMPLKKIETKKVIETKNEPKTNEDLQKDYEKVKLGIENGLLDDKTEPYDDWLKVSFCIFNSFGKDGYELFELFSKRASNYDENENKDFWNKMKPTTKPLTIGTLFMYMKQKDEKLYNELFCKKQYKDEKEKEYDELFYKIISDPTDTEIAKLFNIKYGSNFVCEDIDKKVIFQFTDNNIWERVETNTIRLILSNEMCEDVKQRQEITAENIKDKEKKDQDSILGKYHQLLKKLQSTANKNNICREVLDLIKKSDFSKDMNKQTFLLPIKDKKILNLKTMEIMERTIEHKFSYECNFSMIDLKDDDVEYAKTYFTELFNNNEITTQAFLDLIKTSLTGIPMRNINFFLGSGSNGKSLLFKMLKKGLTSGSMDTISKDVILKKKSNSHLNTELEKTDKCRIGVFSELSEEDQLNEKTIKEITGDDGIDLRTICKTNTTIEPTATLNIITNEMPDFKSAKAINKRIVMFPMNNVFPTNNTKKDEILSKLDVLFTYLLKNGKIMDELVLSDEMKYLKDDVIENNDKNYLKEFIDEKIVREEGKKIKRDDFIYMYKEFCSRNKYRIKEITNTKFSKDLKKIYGIEINDNKKYLNIRWRIESDDVEDVEEEEEYDE